MDLKRNKYLLFAAVTIVFIFYFIFTSNKSDSANYKLIGNDSIVLANTNFQSLADTISKFIDTAFFAEYRVKPNKYLFNYLNGDNKSIPFTLNDTLEDFIFNEAKIIPIYRIWHYGSENFIRFEVLSNAKKIFLTVLSKNQDSIKGRDFEHISAMDFTEAKMIKTLGPDTSIKKIADRIYVVSSSK
jgi:hypothetical protein